MDTTTVHNEVHLSLLSHHAKKHQNNYNITRYGSEHVPLWEKETSTVNVDFYFSA